MARKRVKPVHGEKMIELTLRFWTNGISKKGGYVVKRECWDAGVVYVRSNGTHGLAKDGHPIPFNSLPELAGTVQNALIKSGVRLHPGHKSRRLFG
jgi:hypothetical protein